MRTLAPSLSALTLLAAAAIAQAPGAHWTQLTTNTPTLTTRENPGVANNTNFFVFGGAVGVSSSVRSNALYSYDPVANVWTTLTADGAVGSPSGRSQCAIAWDHARGVLVVFGGADVTGTRLNETWEWNGVAWANVTPVGTSPTARSYAAMAYDWINGKLLMFGGNIGGSPAQVNDTWTWDGTTWTQLSPATVPLTRQQHLMVDRPDHLDIIMAVGQNTVRHADTWRWDGITNNWIQITSATTPPTARVALDAAYDQVRQRVVITGGNNVSTSPTGQCSEFDGVNWVNRTPIPSPRPHDTRYFFAFVPVTGKCYTWGGQSPGTGTWEYQTDSVAQAAPYGTGCTGPGGPLVYQADSLPWTRNQSQNPGPTSFSTTVTGIGPNSFAFLMLSLGQLAPGAFPINPNLVGLIPGPGLGCDLLISSLDYSEGLVPVAGSASWGLTLTDLALDPTLQDLQFYVQMADLEFAGATWVATHTSNGLAMKIGVL